tara:strand:- start:2181 stop:2849 length:669 start_codon:yes stop_codon:yes gene_type:complete
MQIIRLEIGCKNALKQKEFYSDILGLEIFNSTATSFELHLGYSQLFFQENKDFTPYHIAFHIPNKSENQALSWLQQRLSILPFENNDIIDFPAWKAKSIYFYDADLNIMEFISRKDLNGFLTEDFSDSSILGISEIGLATTNIEEKFRFLKENCGLKVYDGNFEKFCAIGEDQGLFITINSANKTWFPTGDFAYNSTFNIKIVHNNKEYKLQYNRNKLSMLQ